MSAWRSCGPTMVSGLYIINVMLICCYLLCYRDGMIKRPGCESYLQKLVEDERKAISRTLLIKTRDTGDGDDSDDGLVMDTAADS